MRYHWVELSRCRRREEEDKLAWNECVEHCGQEMALRWIDECRVCDQASNGTLKVKSASKTNPRQSIRGLFISLASTARRPALLLGDNFGKS